jgi:DUF4097 and DUF4098 domain-containing protein YvlB
MTKTRLATTLIAALFVASASFAQDNERRSSQSFDVGPNGELSLSNISGDIHVEGTSGGKITIEAVKRVHGSGNAHLLDEVEIDISHMGDRVRIETRYPHQRNRRGDHNHDHGGGGVSVEYRVKVPASTEVEVDSVSGNVFVTGIEGETSVESVSGDVQVADTPSLVQATSVSGDVDVERARSEDDLEIASVSGDVRLDDVQAEELDVSSVSGDIRMDAVACEEGEFDSVSGNIHYTGRIAKGGRYEFKSHSGDVIITIGDDIGFELEASTFSGEIQSAFEMRVDAGGHQGQNISAVIGDGSAMIEATTFSGNVVLRSHK